MTNNSVSRQAVNDSKTMCLWTSPISSYVWSTSRTLEWLSQVLKISHLAEYNCHLLYRMTSKSYLMSSLPLLHLYISQCKFHVFISFQDHHPLVQHVLLCTTASSMYEINYWSVHTYIWVLFHSNVSNIQHGVRIEAVFASLQQGEHRHRIQQFLHTFSHPDKKYNSANRINFFKKRGRERFQCIFSVFKYSVFYSISSISTNNSTGFQSFHAKETILHIELILLQEFSKKYFNNNNLIPCRQIQGTLQQLFPKHPSILHGRNPPGHPIRTPRLPVILPAETAF